jgi:hypothetical protein
MANAFEMLAGTARSAKYFSVCRADSFSATATLMSCAKKSAAPADFGQADF